MSYESKKGTLRIFSEVNSQKKKINTYFKLQRFFWNNGH